MKLIKSIWLIILFGFLTNVVNAQLADSMKVIRAEWNQWKKNSEIVIKDFQSDLENHEAKTSNQINAIDNKIGAFENENAWYKYLLAGMGIGSLLAALGFWITADKIVRNRMIKVLDQENEQVAKMFQAVSNEAKIKKEKLIYCLTPDSVKNDILAKLKLWGFKVKSATLTDHCDDFDEKPDCIFFNDPGVNSIATIDLIKNYQKKYPEAALFYFGNLRLGELRNSVIATEFEAYIPGNLMDTMKYK